MPESVSSPRLRHLSRTMAILTTLGIVLAPVLLALAVVDTNWAEATGIKDLSRPISPASRGAVGTVLVIPTAIFVYGLLAVHRLFREFAHGRVLTEQAARHLRTFALTVLVNTVLSPVIQVGTSFAATFANPPGQRYIAFGLSNGEYFGLVVGGVLLAIASVMREAARIADENASIV